MKCGIWLTRGGMHDVRCALRAPAPLQYATQRPTAFGVCSSDSAQDVCARRLFACASHCFRQLSSAHSCLTIRSSASRSLTHSPCSACVSARHVGDLQRVYSIFRSCRKITLRSRRTHFRKFQASLDSTFHVASLSGVLSWIVACRRCRVGGSGYRVGQPRTLALDWCDGEGQPEIASKAPPLPIHDRMRRMRGRQHVLSSA